jgi:hypothetical protein
MELFIIVFIVMLGLTAAMSIGVLLGKKPISGSCGGMSALGMDVACDVCAGDKTICDSENGRTDTSEAAQNEMVQDTLAYDAMKAGKRS